MIDQIHDNGVVISASPKGCEIQMEKLWYPFNSALLGTCSNGSISWISLRLPQALENPITLCSRRVPRNSWYHSHLKSCKHTFFYSHHSFYHLQSYRNQAIDRITPLLSTSLHQPPIVASLSAQPPSDHNLPPQSQPFPSLYCPFLYGMLYSKLLFVAHRKKKFRQTFS